MEPPDAAGLLASLPGEEHDGHDECNEARCVPGCDGDDTRELRWMVTDNGRGTHPLAARRDARILVSFGTESRAAGCHFPPTPAALLAPLDEGYRARRHPSRSGGDQVARPVFATTARDALFPAPDTHGSTNAIHIHLVARRTTVRQVADLCAGAGPVGITLTRQPAQSENPPWRHQQGALFQAAYGMVDRIARVGPELTRAPGGGAS